MLAVGQFALNQYVAHWGVHWFAYPLAILMESGKYRCSEIGDRGTVRMLAAPTALPWVGDLRRYFG